MRARVAPFRRWFAEELRHVAHVRSRAVVEAFATVPRERFLGPGPWRVRSPMRMAQYWTTDDADPRHVHHDVLVALDEARGFNNGQPSLWAALFDDLDISCGARVLHLGCGTGYYSAILAEIVGPRGKVTAVEIDGKLAEQARDALQPWPQAVAIAADGTAHDPGEVDLIVASAGATHPLPLWLDSLNTGGRLLFPLTTNERGGAMLLLTRQVADAFAARFLRPVGFIEFAGARDPEASCQLRIAFGKGDMYSVKSLRRDAHAQDDTCWLHATGWCLSRRDTNSPGSVQP
ncbi:MAG TPA: methyltransferase domain-containing protein [Acetobacteraceae bacterium]|nr:methyltransferase domain-containing protein [Acetobacteraceae bacterium]